MKGHSEKIKHMQKVYSIVEHACNALNWISWHEIDILALFIDYICITQNQIYSSLQADKTKIQ